MQTVLYVSVSTADQTSAHRVKQVEAAGFKVDQIFADVGVSGVSTALADRPWGKRLFDWYRRGRAA